MSELEGVLPVYKPAGWTSHDIVAKARKLLATKRIGHAGTLDPNVTGVLLLCVGRATRIVEYLQEMPKEYVAEMLFGFATDTEDLSGETIDQVANVQLSEQQIQMAVSRFTGTIQQIPPMFSALRHQGQRLYDIARSGMEVKREPREITIYELDIEEISLDRQYPLMRLRVVCSKGTYMRTLCKDIGKALGYPAVMSSLVRTASADIPYTRCVNMEQMLTDNDPQQLAKQYFIPVDQALSHIPIYTVEAQVAHRLKNGQKIRLTEPPLPNNSDAPALLRIYDHSTGFIGLCWHDNGLLIPEKMFH